MTLNNIIDRISTICLAHNQVRSFFAGLIQDALTDKETKYPAVFLQDQGGQISLSGHATTLNYRMFFVDLVNVSQDTKTNEQEVQSDMLSIAEDILTQMNNGGYSDWRISGTNNLKLLVEEGDDMYAGIYVDLNIGKMFGQNACQVPSDLEGYTVVDSSTNAPVFDFEYIANGTEGNTLTIPALAGKRILLVIRENNTLHKVSNLPDTAEYTWNLTDLVLGANTIINERYLILYR